MKELSDISIMLFVLARAQLLRAVISSRCLINTLNVATSNQELPARTLLFPVLQKPIVVNSC